MICTCSDNESGKAPVPESLKLENLRCCAVLLLCQHHLWRCAGASTAPEMQVYTANLGVLVPCWSEMVLLMEAFIYCLLLNDEVRSNTTKPWSSYDPKSQRLLSQECWYWFKHTNYKWVPLHIESDTFSYRVEENQASLFHTQPPQNRNSLVAWCTWHM